MVLYLLSVQEGILSPEWHQVVENCCQSMISTQTKCVMKLKMTKINSFTLSSSTGSESSFDLHMQPLQNVRKLSSIGL